VGANSVNSLGKSSVIDSLNLVYGGISYSIQVFDERATVWWTGKLLKKKKSLSEYIGRN
jgi:hypothetical protein